MFGGVVGSCSVPSSVADSESVGEGGVLGGVGGGDGGGVSIGGLGEDGRGCVVTYSPGYNFSPGCSRMPWNFRDCIFPR